MVISFEELRGIKDKLPTGSINRIALELGVDADYVRNFFGGDHYDGESAFPDVHFEKTATGTVVQVDDTAILECAKKIIAEAYN